MILLGDIHGNWNVLNDVLEKYPNEDIIQVGDMGLGFAYNYAFLNQKTGLWETAGLHHDPTDFPSNFKYIRGNHDNPEKCRQYSNYLGDYGFDEKTGIFFVSGAWSIDADNRTPFIDWWPDEELSYVPLLEAFDLYVETKPDIVISHTCPASIARFVLNPQFGDYKGNRTETMLEKMFRNHQPKKWFFGHWHMDKSMVVENTTFRCIGVDKTCEM